MMNHKNLMAVSLCLAGLISSCTDNSAVSAYLTTSDRTHELAYRRIEPSKNPLSNGTVITLNPEVRYQTMDGFGTAVTGSACYNLMRMAPEDRTRFLTETFSHEKGYGHSYIRVSIGCSDFSLSEYTCCDTPGIENFALQEEETAYVIPILKEILAINPDIKILGSPWTCPTWMKVNNLTELRPYPSWTSGHLNPKYYQDYGLYFVKWIQAMAREGVTVQAVTPQNEPLNRGNSASLFMGWREELAFVKEALGPQLRKAGLDTQLYAFDHNYNYDNMSEERQYPLNIYDDETAAAFLTGAAYHNYGGDKEELNRIQKSRPDKELVFTETSIGMWNDGRNLTRRLTEDMREVGLGTVNNWCKGVIVWNLMLDTQRGPNREGGCTVCYGAVDIDKSNYKTITRNSHYYVISHLAAVVKPGATRIQSTGVQDENLIYSAFENTDGTYAFVVMNDSESTKRFGVNTPKGSFTYEIPAKAVASFRTINP